MSLTEGSSPLPRLARPVLAAACGAPDESTPAPAEQRRPCRDKPSSAVTLNILDVAGNLQLTQGDDRRLRQGQHPDIDLQGHLLQGDRARARRRRSRRSRTPDRVDIDLVLTGTDGLAAGIEQDLWPTCSPTTRPPARHDDYLPPRRRRCRSSPAGPRRHRHLLPVRPAARVPARPRSPSPPTTAEELLAWAKANPGKFQYARPAQLRPRPHVPDGPALPARRQGPEGPGQRLGQDLGLPEGARTSTSSYYPSGTTETMKNLANGSRDIIASTTGWDINPRVLGTVPKEAKIGTLDGFHWVTDAHYAVVPKGVSADKQAAVAAADEVHAHPGAAGEGLRQGLLLPGPGGQGRRRSTWRRRRARRRSQEFGRPGVRRS